MKEKYWGLEEQTVDSQSLGLWDPLVLLATVVYSLSYKSSGLFVDSGFKIKIVL